AEVRLPNSAIFVYRFVGPARSRVAKPFRQGMLLIVGHETNGKSLMMLTRFLESCVQDLPTDAIGSRLKFTPEPTAISNGCIGKNRFRGRLCVFSRGTFF